MPKHTIYNLLLSSLILVPFVAGVWRYAKMDRVFHPLVWICGIGVLAESWRLWEVLQFYQINRPTNMLGYNLYIVIVSQVYLILFYRWHLFKGTPALLRVLQIGLLLIWVADHFVFQGNRVMQPTLIFRLVYASVLSLLAVQQINSLIIGYRKNLLTSPSFLICAGILLLYFPYILQEALHLAAPNLSQTFFVSVFSVRPRLNALVYLLFLLALLWTPRKKPFMML